MQYKKKLIELILAEDEIAFTKWINEQPLIEQPDILREFKQLVEELIEEDIATMPEEDVEQIGVLADNYEEDILDAQVALLMHEVATEDRRKWIISNIKERIETNAPNAEAMKQLARLLIEKEKKENIFNPADWDWLEG